jgi:hypothetical protein
VVSDSSFLQPFTLKDHDYFTRRQKKLGAMDPNGKLLFEEFVKQVDEEIQDAFALHESNLNARFSDLNPFPDHLLSLVT